ncbi:hypothetical protein [Arthrobacter sp. H5]|uniref:hypothetical protein n=1 Tax=Arthrobacter sp. H5 TaxID=1267973 RepID=UPI0004837D94|nr:hypothetical protein [Arthrobacter sp. H5]
MTLGPAVSIMWLRLVSVAVAAALGIPLWRDTPWVILPVMLFAAAALRPFILLPLVSILLIIGSYAANGPVGSPVLLLYVAGLHLLYVLYAFLLSVPMNALVSTAVLKQALFLVLKVQLIAQPLAAVALLVSNVGPSTPVVLVSAVAMVSWGYWLLRTYRRSSARRAAGPAEPDDGAHGR